MTERRPPAEAPVEVEQGGRRLADAPASAGRGWWPALLVLLQSAAVATVALVSQWTVSRVNNSGPDEGFYWTVAQYQIAHHRLKQELRAIAAGEPANPEELSRRVAVFASKGSILNEPSEVKDHLDGVY